jgi:excisionase family DNA binding protein
MSAELHQFGTQINLRQPKADVTQREWMDLKALTQYACVSERTLREWIHRPDNPLPAVRVGSKLLVRRSTFDLWLENHRLKPADLSCIVDEIVEGVTARN